MNERSKTYRPYLFALIFMAYGISYVGRKGFSACMSDIDRQLSIGKAFCGIISTGYLASYGSGQMIFGLIGDKVSPSRMIFTGLLGVALCNTFMGTASSPAFLLILWCLNGLCNSMLWPPVIRAIALWVPKEKQIRSATLISASLPAGSILSYVLSSLCLRFFSWRVSFIVSGSLILFCALLWLYATSRSKEYIRLAETCSPAHSSTIQNKNTSQEHSGKKEDNSPASAFTLAACVFSTGLLFAVIGILFNGMIKDGVTEWVPVYLSDYFSVSSSAAALLTGVLPVINLTGVFLGTFINEHITHNEMMSAAILFGICTLSITLLYFLGSFHVLPAVMLLGISTASMLGANNMFLSFMPLHFASVGRASSVTGLLNAMSYLFAAFSSSFIGFLAQHFGWNTTILSWILGAILGLLTCFIGSFFWKKGVQKLKENSYNTENTIGKG